MSVYLRVFGVESGELAFEHVNALVARRELESDWLDYKRQLPSGQDAYRKLAESVSAFANAQGGLLLFGIKDKADAADELRPVSLGPELDSMMRGVNNYLHPPVRGLTILAIPSAKGANEGVAALEVPASLDAPHAALQSNGALGYWRRNGRSKFAMSEPEVERQYRARGEDRERRHDTLLGLHQRAGKELQEPAFVLAAVPLNWRGRCYASPGNGRSILDKVRSDETLKPQWGSESTVGRESRARLGAVEGGSWIVRNEEARGEEHAGSWWCRIERTGSLASAFRAWPVHSQEGALLDIPYQITPNGVETGIVDALLTIRALAAASEMPADGFALRVGLTGALPLAIYDIFDMLDGLKMSSDTVCWDLEAGLETDQEVLRCAQEIVVDLYSAYGIIDAQLLIKEAAPGRLSLNANWRRGIEQWCRGKKLPLTES